MMRLSALLILTLGVTCFACGEDEDPITTEETAITSSSPVSVSGTGIHYFSTAVIHSTEETATGMIQRSSDFIEITGDLEGKVLYHPVSVFDFVENTLVNTGDQVFSGSVLGSDPILLFDNQFRFEVDLGTGATMGQVFLRQSKDAATGSWYECDLDMVGTGLTEAGDGTVSYTGTCVSKTES